jgi:hypothetical protein
MGVVDNQAENGGNDYVTDSLSRVGFNRAAEVDDVSFSLPLQPPPPPKKKLSSALSAPID